MYVCLAYKNSSISNNSVLDKYQFKCKYTVCLQAFQFSQTILF